MRIPALLLTVSASLFAQTLGQFRLVDFSARNPAKVKTVSGGVNLTTDKPHGLNTGAAVYIYPPWNYTTDSINKAHGNLGRGYFVITAVDDTHLTLSTDMYTNQPSTGNGVAAGDVIIPLTTYYLRQGPRLFLDGPINKGTWSAGTTYRSHEMVQAPDGNSYIATTDSKNQQPPNATYWEPVAAPMVGPGTFTASLRNTSGKAKGSNYPYNEIKTLIDTYFPQPQTSYDWATTAGTGSGGTLEAWRWFADDSATYYAGALRLATQAEDLANGSVECDPASPTGYCGRGVALDYNRLDWWKIVGALGAIYDTLTTDQKHTLANKLLNDNDVLHNGVEAPGNGCTPLAPIQGAFSAADQITGQNYAITGTGFLAKAGLAPGSIIFASPFTGWALEAIGRVKSIDSDKHLTMERAYYSRVGNIPNPAIYGYYTANEPGTSAPGSNTPWYYTPPWNDADHSCGVKWWLSHHPSTPTIVTGEESHYGADYLNGGTNDSSMQNNRTISALVPWIGMGLLLSDIDIRAVRLTEQSINYYMTQWMAQNAKSRWTGFDGHGTQYGPGRATWGTLQIAWMLKNSLTVTPPGILTGNYLRNTLRSYNYTWWNALPYFVQPWETGYGIAFNADISGGMELINIGPAMLLAANLYPSDPFAPRVWDYLRNRRGDFGISKTGGWTTLTFTAWAFPFYDPAATQTTIATAPLQQGLFDPDEQECIASGLYCRVDTGQDVAFSTTGWTNTDTQVFIQGQSSLPTYVEDNYAPAGAITILQNNGANSAYLLGGNGLNLSGFSPSGGMYDSSTVMIYNPTTYDRVPGKGTNYMFAGLDRWAGTVPDGVVNNSYAYTRVNFSPSVREASTSYLTAVPKTWYTAAGAVTREILHFKSGPTLPNYVVTYDSFQGVASGNQLRAYWHLYDLPNAAAGFAGVKHAEWVNLDSANKAATLVSPGTGRLNLKTLAVPGSSNPTVALIADNYVPPPFTSYAYQDSNLLTTNQPATWADGVATVTASLYPWGAYPLPTDGSVSISVTGVNSTGPGSFNGTFPVTGYTNSGATRISYALPTDPGTWVSGGKLSYPAWCTYVTPNNPAANCTGAYFRPTDTGLPDNPWPLTYRVSGCASSDGTTCDTEAGAEFLTVLQPSPDTTATMPALAQPSCSATGGNCTALEIQDNSYPKVAAFARQGALVKMMTFTTTHGGTAQYVVSGLAPGTYEVKVNGAHVASATVTSGDTTLSFSSTSGAVSITPTTGSGPAASVVDGASKITGQAVIH
jgi:hypothetical protein